MATDIAGANRREENEPSAGNVDDKAEKDIDSPHGEDSSSEEGSSEEDGSEVSEKEDDGYPRWTGGRPRAPVKNPVVGKDKKKEAKEKEKEKSKEQSKSRDDKDKNDKDKDKGVGSKMKKTTQPVAGPSKS
ncbi:hypothetical protein BDN70DRAFT_871716 [Pholiota conissans]|uniref:Uncharacterized protein n=1 Tax=Pholiota conissans TaxID=109636 RepID=A0A9P5ZE61_9AGAR|nr:hypothetical protein BDN70DRAFT_871716 [Pholiota conissans]